MKDQHTFPGQITKLNDSWLNADLHAVAWREPIGKCTHGQLIMAHSLQAASRRSLKA